MTQNSTIQRPKIALFEPDIPQNTAAIMRLCACFGVRLDIIEPCGFFLNDRKFKENNHRESQVTLIEIENINYYNNKTGTFIPPINFRRNIITEGIQLNELIGREFLVGKVKLRAHDLCRPCKYLQESLGQKNLVKLMLQKSGLRCEILSSGKISINDQIIS